MLWAIVMKKKGASYGNREGLLDQLLDGRDPETVFTQDGLLDELKKGLSERVLNAELDAETADGKSNRHNGRSQKTVLTGTSKVTLDIPRDRVGTFDPQLIAKYQRRFPDFDQKIISMYARDMTVREIRGHLQELYGTCTTSVTTGAMTSSWRRSATAAKTRKIRHLSTVPAAVRRKISAGPMASWSFSKRCSMRATKCMTG